MSEIAYEFGYNGKKAWGINVEVQYEKGVFIVGGLFKVKNMDRVLVGDFLELRADGMFDMNKPDVPVAVLASGSSFDLTLNNKTYWVSFNDSYVIIQGLSKRSAI